MKTLQMALVFVIAFSLGVYVANHNTLSLTPPLSTGVNSSEQGCKTDLLVVFPFAISQRQLTTVIDALYGAYPEWSIQRDGATTPRVLIHATTTATIDEIKLESKAVGEQPALCFTPELRKEIEALAADTLQKTALK